MSLFPVAQQRFPGVVLNDRSSGYFGAIYSGYRDDRWGDRTSLLVFANRGTTPSEFQDLANDGEQAAGWEAQQYELARENARIVANGLRQGEQLAFTGHSLGGGLAQAQALFVGGGTHAYTFNSAGLHERYQAGRSIGYRRQHIHAMNVDGEFLNFGQDNARLVGQALGDIGRRIPWLAPLILGGRAIEDIPPVVGDRTTVSPVHPNNNNGAQGYDFSLWTGPLTFENRMLLHGNLAISNALINQMDRLARGRL